MLWRREEKKPNLSIYLLKVAFLDANSLKIKNRCLMEQVYLNTQKEKSTYFYRKNLKNFDIIR